MHEREFVKHVRQQAETDAGRRAGNADKRAENEQAEDLLQFPQFDLQAVGRGLPERLHDSGKEFLRKLKNLVKNVHGIENGSPAFRRGLLRHAATERGATVNFSRHAERYARCRAPLGIEAFCAPK